MPESLTEKLGREPRYLLSDAAELADVPAKTLRTWIVGWPAARNRNPQPACIKLDGLPSEPLTLSFFNVIEAGFLAAYRAKGAAMQRIRHALDHSKEQLKTDRPLLHVDFKVSAKDLFYEYQEESGVRGLVNASRGGQKAWPDMVESYLHSIQYDEHGPILRWLFGAERPIIGIDPKLAFGLPCIVGRGIPTHIVLGRLQAGESHAEIVEDFGITPEEVDEALRWETRPLRRAA